MAVRSVEKRLSPVGITSLKNLDPSDMGRVTEMESGGIMKSSTKLRSWIRQDNPNVVVNNHFPGFPGPPPKELLPQGDDPTVEITKLTPTISEHGNRIGELSSKLDQLAAENVTNKNETSKIFRLK